MKLRTHVWAHMLFRAWMTSKLITPRAMGMGLGQMYLHAFVSIYPYYICHKSIAVYLIDSIFTTFGETQMPPSLRLDFLSMQHYRYKEIHLTTTLISHSMLVLCPKYSRKWKESHWLLQKHILNIVMCDFVIPAQRVAEGILGDFIWY